MSEKGNSWSLEHVHAQNSDDPIKTVDAARIWVDDVMCALKGVEMVCVDDEENVNGEEIPLTETLEELKAMSESSNMDMERFNSLKMELENIFNGETIHDLCNMALISKKDNSALNKSIFPVKRAKIIELEKAGFFRRNEKRLAREQRKLSRCVKESRNYVRQKKKVARCHEKIRNQRKDYLHKLSRRITDQYDIVAVEDIDMKAMSQCLHFGKSIQDNGYGMFRNMLDYKLAWKGKELVKVDRFFPSSKKCSKCGKIKKELKLSERVYRCTCGNEMDRDRNAAINIREEARRMLAA